MLHKEVVHNSLLKRRPLYKSNASIIFLSGRGVSNTIQRCVTVFKRFCPDRSSFFTPSRSSKPRPPAPPLPPMSSPTHVCSRVSPIKAHLASTCTAMFLRDGWWKVAARNLGGLRRRRGDISPILDLTRGQADRGTPPSMDPTTKNQPFVEVAFLFSILDFQIWYSLNLNYVPEIPRHGGHRYRPNFSGKKRFVFIYDFRHIASPTFLSRNSCKNYVWVWKLLADGVYVFFINMLLSTSDTFVFLWNREI